MQTEYESALDRAAEGCGVESRFWDIFGREHVASEETKRAIVQALGVPASSRDTIDTALYFREETEWKRVVAPALVLTFAADHLSFPMTLPDAELSGIVKFRIRLEEGGTIDGEQRIEGVPVEERRRFDELWARIRFQLPVQAPLGYHEIEIKTATRRATAQLIIAPVSAWQPDWLDAGKKTAGLAVALYGLRSARNWGVGDFTDLRTLCHWSARELGVTFIALNPLHAIHNRRPYNTSPYLPNSMFFQNFLYLDLEAMEEWEICERARRCFTTHPVQSELKRLRESASVEYERVRDVKLRFLRLLFAEFLRTHWKADSPRAQEFRQFQKEGGELLRRFGLYCALDEYLHRQDPNLWIWTDWPEPYQRPDSAESVAFAKKHWRSVMFYEYCAWQTAAQLDGAQKEAIAAGLPIGLYHDLALATDRYGSDIWAHRDFFAQGCRVGSPPDDFSPQGQDWGFPPPNTIRHREDGYHLFRESIRRSCQHGGALRIDHVMRFFRLYWIPDGMNATQGAYVRDRAEDLVKILALESVRSRVLMVGEDLGTVEPYIREILGKSGILSYRLFYFERHRDGCYRLPEEYPVQALVSSTTHDLPTLAGFWTGADIEARRAAGVLSEAELVHQRSDRTRDKQRMLDALFRANLLPPNYPRHAEDIPELNRELHDAAMGFLARTPSMLLLVNQEDLTLEPHQQNLPGTTSQYPNWGRKMRFSLEELGADPQACELTQKIAALLRATSRACAGSARG